jgi:hypothetical protein
MANPISDFMGNWMNTTYKYLKESGGGPTFPQKKASIGPVRDALPTGGYSLIEDVGLTEIPITQYGSVPLPFNPGATGLAGAVSSQADAANEIAKENPTPPVISTNFQRIYGSSMNACINDQTWGLAGKNPDPSGACNLFAQMGDPSLMLLSPARQKLIGITISQENDKPTEVQLAENETSLTGQIKTGLLEGAAAWSGFKLGTSALLTRDPSGNKTIIGDPAGNNFQTLNDRLKAFFPEMPSIPNLNSPVILIGAAVVGVVLLIAIVK